MITTSYCERLNEWLSHLRRTLHLLQIATGVVVDDVPDVVLRLVSFNGSVSDQFDEKFSAIHNDLSNSRLLVNFAEKRFTMCYGLAKLPKRTQVLVLFFSFSQPFDMSKFTLAIGVPVLVGGMGVTVSWLVHGYRRLWGQFASNFML